MVDEEANRCRSHFLRNANKRRRLGDETQGRVTVGLGLVYVVSHEIINLTYPSCDIERRRLDWTGEDPRDGGRTWRAGVILAKRGDESAPVGNTR